MTKSDYAAARAMLESGKRLIDVAAHYGVSTARVRAIVPYSDPCCMRCFVKTTAGARMCEKCRAESIFRMRYNACACGARKTKNAARCRKCAGLHQRRFDVAEADYLYSCGLSAVCIASYYKVIPAAIYLAFRKIKRKITFNTRHVNDRTIRALLKKRNVAQTLALAI